MNRQLCIRSLAGLGAMAAVFLSAAGIASTQSPLALATSRVTLAGTSNVHAYTASTITVRLVRVQVPPAVAGPEFWTEILKPGAVEAFEIAIPAARLASDKEGLDKNMHKALKTAQHPDITFKLTRLEPAAKALRATGTLKIAGVEREVAFDVTTQRMDATLTVKGTVDILMTDYGITPPKAMLGMLKTDPKVTVTFETVLAVPLT